MKSAMLAKAFTACLLLAVVAGQAAAHDDPKNDGSKVGADVTNDEKAANQDNDDMKANADAVGEDLLAVTGVSGTAPTPVISEASQLGGKGGVDPATGETLLPLPAESEFCKSTGQKASDGTQQVGGSCSSVSQGQIPKTDKMVSTIIVEPQNQAKIPLGQDFQVSVVTANLKTGFFDAASTEYYTQPQTLDDQGIIKGHQHITVQKIADKNRPPNANEKQFFKGLNDAADGSGKLSVTVNGTAITEPGLYRICSMTGTFAHQPVVMPVAQRGAQDDCIRVEIKRVARGNNSGAGRAAATANNENPSHAAATAGNTGNNAGSGPQQGWDTADKLKNKNNDKEEAPLAPAGGTANPTRATATAVGATPDAGAVATNGVNAGTQGMHMNSKNNKGAELPRSAATAGTAAGNGGNDPKNKKGTEPPRSAATAGTAAGNGGGAGGQGKQSAEDVVAEILADLAKLKSNFAA